LIAAVKAARITRCSILAKLERGEPPDAQHLPCQPILPRARDRRRYIEGIEAVIRAGSRGRYHVDHISSEPLPSGHTSRRWGTGVKWPDG
jgi:hypothetical protein